MHYCPSGQVHYQKQSPQTIDSEFHAESDGSQGQAAQQTEQQGWQGEGKEARSFEQQLLRLSH